MARKFKQQLTKDEIQHLAIQNEGCLNSRPLWPISDDPSDPQPLTPAHFIIGKPILPQPVAEDVTDVEQNRLTVWGKRQKMIQQFWRRWREEFLTEKQTRNKWYNVRTNLKIGNMVSGSSNQSFLWAGRPSPLCIGENSNRRIGKANPKIMHSATSIG